MSGFFDKIKKGATEAGNKAKILVDINRIKLQISQKEKEIEELYRKIGKVVFEAFQKPDTGDVEKFISDYSNEILAKQEEIAKFQKEINELNAKMNESTTVSAKDNTDTDITEKKCACGKPVAKDARFCPSCGYNFQNELPSDEAKEDVKPIENICPECGAVVESGVKFCGNCGHMMNK